MMHSYSAMISVPVDVETTHKNVERAAVCAGALQLLSGTKSQHRRRAA